jgi:hypothetical protein
MREFPKYDWNVVAAGVQMLPDEAIRMALDTAPGVDAMISAWEGVWAQSLSSMGLGAGTDLALHSKVLREVMLGFYRAEAIRRGLNDDG